MKKNLLARGIEKIGKASAENSANKKLIIMLHEPKNQDRIRTGVSKHGKTVLETREYAVSGTGSNGKLRTSG